MDGCVDFVKTSSVVESSTSRIKINLKKKPEEPQQSSFSENKFASYKTCYEQFQAVTSKLTITSSIVGLVNLPVDTGNNVGDIIHMDMCTEAHQGLFCKNTPVVTKDGEKILLKFPHELMAISFFNKHDGKYFSEDENMTFEEDDKEEVADTSVYSIDIHGRIESIFLCSVSMELFKVKLTNGSVMKSPFLMNFYSTHGTLASKVLPVHLLKSDEETLDEIRLKIEGGKVYLENEAILDEEEDSVAKMLNNLISFVGSNLESKVRFDKAVMIFSNWEEANIFIDLINHVEMGDDIKSALYCIGILPDEDIEQSLGCQMKLFGYEPKIDPNSIHEKNVMMNALLEKFIRISYSSLGKLLRNHTLTVDSIKNLICKEPEVTERKKEMMLTVAIGSSSTPKSCLENCFTDSEVLKKTQKIPESLKFLRWTKMNEATSPRLQDPRMFLLSLKTTHMNSIKWVSAVSVLDMACNNIVLNVAVIPNHIFNKLPKTSNKYCIHCDNYFVFHVYENCPSLDLCLRCPNQPPHTLAGCLLHALSCWNCGGDHSWRECPSEAILTPSQRELHKVGYRFNVREGQAVCTFLTAENVEIPCVGEREVIKKLSSLLEGGINIFLGYSIYEVVMELLKMVGMNFQDNHFFVSLVHGIIDIKSLFTEVGKDASLKECISSITGQSAPAFDTPGKVCQQVNQAVRRKYSFSDENIIVLCKNFAVISSSFLTKNVALNGIIKTPTKCDNKGTTKKKPTLIPNLEELSQQRSINEIYSYVYLYFSWRGRDVLEMKVKAVSKFREKQLTAQRNIHQTLLDFHGYMESNIDFFPNPVLVTLCPESVRILDLGLFQRLFVGHFDLWTAAFTDSETSLGEMKTDDKTKLQALYRETCKKSMGEYQSVLWTMEDIHGFLFKSRNFEDLPIYEMPDNLYEAITESVDEISPTGRLIETLVTGGMMFASPKVLAQEEMAVSSQTSVQQKERRKDREENTKSERKVVYSGHSFIYIDLKLKGDSITKLKIKAESRLREKHLRDSEDVNAKAVLEKMLNYLQNNTKYPKPLCITASEEKLDGLTSNLKAMGLLEQFLVVFHGRVDLSWAVEKLDSKVVRYKAFSKSGRSGLEKDYASVFGKLINHQTALWSMRELHLETMKNSKHEIEFKSLKLLFPPTPTHVSSNEEEAANFRQVKRKSKELIMSEAMVNIFKESEELIDEGRKKIKIEPSDEITSLEELSCNYMLKVEDLEQEYEKKQDLCRLLAENENANSGEVEEFTVEALDTVEILSGQTKALVGRILCFSSQISNAKLKLLTHPTLIPNFAPSFQFVRSRATSTSEEDLVKVFHVVLHMTNLSDQDLVVEKETILGSACAAVPEDLMLKGRKRIQSTDIMHFKEDDDIADTCIDDIKAEPLGEMDG